MAPAINPIYPVETIRSVDELMDIATAMEHEAATRYEELAAEMERQHVTDLAAVFHDLAKLEREHEAGIARWAERQGWRTPQPAQFSWQMPETFGAEGGEAHVLTPYRALSIAVRNEERAFSFYSYLAAISPNPEIQRRAEALAREELAHVSQLRRLRRSAYHAADQRVPSPTPQSSEEFQKLADGLERASAELDAAVSRLLETEGFTIAADVLRRIERPGAGSADSPGSQVAEAARAAGMLRPGMLLPLGGLQLALRDGEEVLEIYLEAARRGKDEEVVRLAQERAEAAIARLALIRGLLDVIEES